MQKVIEPDALINEQAQPKDLQSNSNNYNEEVDMQNNNLEASLDKAKILIKVLEQVIDSEVGQPQMDDNQLLLEDIYLNSQVKFSSTNSSIDSDEEVNKDTAMSIFANNNNEEQDMMIAALLGINLLLEYES